MKDLSNLPLTKNQRRLWISYLQDKSNPAYNLKLTYHLKGDLNIELFDKSLGLLFDQQHTVYSVFRQKDGLPYIEIIPRKLVIEHLDFSLENQEDVIKKIYSLVASDSRKPFDIETGPLFRLYLLKAADNDYYFHATIHHIIFDGFSRRVFVQEISKIYNCLLLEKFGSIEQHEYQSYDFADWEMKSPSEFDENQLIGFWKENLRDSPSELKFPFDFNRTNHSTGYGYRESFSVPESIGLRLRQLSAESGSTLFETVLSALGLLFHKYTGEDDICIGIPVSTRLRNPKLWKIFGYFVNTSVVRIKIDENSPASKLIAFTSNAAKNAIAHSNLPFEKIVEVVRPARIPGINPLFQVSLSWFTNFTVPMDLGNIVGERVNVNEGVSPFDITFLIWENGGKIDGEIEYDIDLLEHETIVRLKENFIRLLEIYGKFPDQNISELSILSEKEIRRLNEINNTEAQVPDCLIHNLFEKKSLLNPHKRAISSGSVSMTYGELNKRANQLAWHIISKGVVPGSVIGICIERSCEMAVSVLGILKAGCCYLPIDPSLPSERIDYMLEDSAAKFMITQESYREKFQGFKHDEIVFIDNERDIIGKLDEKTPSLNADNQSLAYLMYTSGSTGRPKGVKVPHQSVVNFILSMAKKPGFHSDDRLLAVTTLSFDISVLEVFLPLSTGAETIIAKSDEVSDGQKLSNLLELHDITVLQATPVTWTLLLGSGWAGKKNLKTLCGGEPISPGLIKALLPLVESLWNMYGPTETTVWSTCFRITDPSAPVLVGLPVDNTQIYILDKHNKPLPSGSIGEVCIGGLGVTKGYHNRLELTQEKFINFDSGRIVYKTGDLGRFLKNGNLELFGRIDNQIKLRGFRIETGEIESLLLNIKGIKEAVVKIHEFDKSDQRMVAFLNVDPDFSMSNDQMVKLLARNLPSYMIPSFFQKSEGFPRMPNGKINRKALLLDIEEQKDMEGEEERELSKTQKTIMNIFEDVLKIKNIRIGDNFFDVGGNSLLAIAVFSKIEAAFNIQLSLRIFFDGPRIKDLAEVVDFTLYKSTERKPNLETSSVIIKGEI
jgi:amino acid adenylation domain-containing protein